MLTRFLATLQPPFLLYGVSTNAIAQVPLQPILRLTYLNPQQVLSSLTWFGLQAKDSHFGGNKEVTRASQYEAGCW